VTNKVVIAQFTPTRIFIHVSATLHIIQFTKHETLVLAEPNLVSMVSEVRGFQDGQQGLGGNGS
jgi:hypothetical protein